MEKILDIAIVAIILICIWSGYKKGLIMGVGGIIVIVVSMFAANLLSNTFSYEVIPAMRPFASGYMDTIDVKVLEKMGFDEKTYSVEDLLIQNPELKEDFCVTSYEEIGIHGSTARLMAQEAMQHADEQNEDIRTAIVEVLCQKVAFAMGFLLAFLIVLIVLTVIGNLPNLSFKIPHMDLLNDIGGAVMGLLTAALLVSVIVWALKFAGIVIGPETLENTILAKFFLKLNLLGSALGL